MISELEKMSKEEQLIVDIELSAHSIVSALCSMRKSIEQFDDKQLSEDTLWLVSEMEKYVEKVEFGMWKLSKRNGKV